MKSLNLLLLSTSTLVAADATYDNVTINETIHDAGYMWSIDYYGQATFDNVYSQTLWGNVIDGNGLFIDGDGNFTGLVYAQQGYFADLAGNGPNITHITAAHIDHQLIQTNFISGKSYVNNCGTLIKVSGTVELTVTNQAGLAAMELRSDTAPQNGGWTNKVSVQTTSATVPTTFSQYIAVEVQTNALFCFTNSSTGGNSAKVLGGQISY